MNRNRFLVNTVTAVLSLGIIAIGVLLIRKDHPGQLKQGPVSSIYLPDKDIHTIARQDSILWVGGKQGLAALNLVDSTEIVLTGQLSNIRYVRALLTDSEGFLWIGSDQGLAVVKDRQVYPDFVPDHMASKKVNALFQDRENRLWVGTWSGVFVRQDTEWQDYDTDSLLHEMVNVITQDQNGGYFFGSYVAPRGGLTYRGVGQWDSWTVDSGLPHANISSITTSRDSVWVGTGLYRRGGLLTLAWDEESCRWDIAEVKRKKDGLTGEKVRSLLKDQEGRLWVGYEYDGADLFYGEDKIHLSTRIGLSHDEVKAFFESEDGMWIGTRSGLNYIDLESLELLF